MSDILSQGEIDNLLSALTSGDTPIALKEEIGFNEIKAYDFKNPSKFSKEQLRTLEIIFDNLSRLLTSYLTGYLRTNVSIEVLTSEQITYNNFTNSLSNPTIIAIADFEPFKGSIVLELSMNLGYAIIDRILGGPGYPMNESRDLSDIEKTLLERVFAQILYYMRESWANVAEITPKFDKIETNVQFAQVLPPNEVTALITLEFKVGGSTGFLNFCIPHVVVEPIMQKLNSTNWFTTIKDEEKGSLYKEHLETSLENARVNVSAIVGKTTVTVRDFINLQEGDVLLLDSYVNSEVSVKVGNLVKFYAKPGISRGKNAIQITSIRGKEE
ncbi:flagellar motor switch protein FliM [Anaeropeptidivorans aminofermentans]|jgi:flagellar motor switch protein FliM|uniref:flagellar motor switch protein FliM n=1 Tax=Anaeropeptidivorans aminofermentans TaxID=2934315 RepID=UPI0020246A3C|nr:flagellar motor switch protein FliM [Anaeropeptidivorans aminofermentans]MBE6011942.1 flagellar motor switch protein FliM [Lachnospiraceae bacterium]